MPRIRKSANPKPNAYMNSKLLGALLLLSCSSAASAQVFQGTSWTESSSCVEHLPPSAFRRVAVSAYVDLRDSVSADFAQTADNFMQDLVTTTQRQLGMTGNKLPVGEPAVNWRGEDKSLHLVAYKDGRIVVVDRDSIRLGTAAWLAARALDSMSTAGDLEWSADSARDSVRFDIAFVRPVLDSAGHAEMRKNRRAALPVFSVLAPWERQVAAKPGQRAPRYPDEALHEGYEATILLQFIVDTTGRADVSSVRDLWPKEKARLTGRDLEAYQSFLDETERALVKIEFNPAEIGGCPVKQLVQMPFTFALRR